MDLQFMCHSCIEDDYYRGIYFNKDVVIHKPTSYLNVSQLCHQFSKNWLRWLEIPATFDLIFSCINMQYLRASPIKLVNHHNSQLEGVYMHPLLIPHIMSWLSPQFAIVASRFVHEKLYIRKSMTASADEFIPDELIHVTGPSKVEPTLKVETVVIESTRVASPQDMDSSIQVISASPATTEPVAAAAGEACRVETMTDSLNQPTAIDITCHQPVASDPISEELPDLLTSVTKTSLVTTTTIEITGPATSDAPVETKETIEEEEQGATASAEAEANHLSAVTSAKAGEASSPIYQFVVVVKNEETSKFPYCAFETTKAELEHQLNELRLTYPDLKVLMVVNHDPEAQSIYQTMTSTLDMDYEGSHFIVHKLSSLELIAFIESNFAQV